MLERYRTLRAAYDLRAEPFTASELAKLSGVQAQTVRTILARESQLLERVGKERTGARGGQRILYKLRPEGESELETLFAAVDRIAVDRSSNHAELIPTSLLAGEEILLKLHEDLDLDSRQAKLELAWLGLNEGHAAVEAAGAGARAAINTHLVAVDALLGLAQLEEVQAETSGADESRLNVLREQLDGLGRILEPLDPHLWEQIQERVDSSPLAEQLAPPLGIAELVSLDPGEARLSKLVMRVLQNAELDVKRLDELSLHELPDVPVSSDVRLSILVLGEVEHEPDIVRLFAERRMPGERTILLDALGTNPELAEEAWRNSIIYISGSSATEEALTGAVDLALAAGRVEASAALIGSNLLPLSAIVK